MKWLPCNDIVKCALLFNTLFCHIYISICLEYCWLSDGWKCFCQYLGLHRFDSWFQTFIVFRLRCTSYFKISCSTLLLFHTLLWLKMLTNDRAMMFANPLLIVQAMYYTSKGHSVYYSTRGWFAKYLVRRICFPFNYWNPLHLCLVQDYIFTGIRNITVFYRAIVHQ